MVFRISTKSLFTRCFIWLILNWKRKSHYLAWNSTVFSKYFPYFSVSVEDFPLYFRPIWWWYTIINERRGPMHFSCEHFAIFHCKTDDIVKKSRLIRVFLPIFLLQNEDSLHKHVISNFNTFSQIAPPFFVENYKFY